MKKLFEILVFCLLFISTFAYAEIYKWVDAQGNTHFTDSPPIESKAEVIEVKVNSYTSVEIKPLAERLSSNDKVIMYVTARCGYCKKAKQYFRSNNIPYKAHDIEKSRVGKRDFKLLKGKSVPIIIVGQKRMNGFNVTRFNKLYESWQQKKNSPAKDKSVMQYLNDFWNQL